MTGVQTCALPISRISIRSCLSAACMAGTEGVLLFNNLSYHFLLIRSTMFLCLNWMDTSMRSERVAEEHESMNIVLVTVWWMVVRTQSWSLGISYLLAIDAMLQNRSMSLCP